MIALKIKNVKQFMNLLFSTDTFDGFTLEEAVIKTFASYNIDGLYERGFFDGDDTAGKSGFITALYIILVPLLGLFIGRRVRAVLWLSVILSLVGLVLLNT